MLAIEQLGASLLGNIETARVEDGVKALGTANNRVLDWLKMLMGLHRDGLTSVMRNSTACVASFLLSAACKTVFTDTESAHILFNMMNNRGILRAVPLTKQQVEEAIVSFSGHAQIIVPTDLFEYISASVVQSHYEFRKDNTGPHRQLFQPSTPETIAKILFHTFEALQDEDVSKVSLEGMTTGIWLASVFVWLMPRQTELLNDEVRILGNAGARVSICFTLQRTWTIKKWKHEQDIFSVVAIGDSLDAVIKHGQDLSLNHTPLQSAHRILSIQHHLNPDLEQEMGQLTGALVDVVFEHGHVRYSIVSGSSVIPLREIFQKQFIGRYHNIMELYGFRVDETFHSVQQKFYQAIFQMI